MPSTISLRSLLAFLTFFASTVWGFSLKLPSTLDPTNGLRLRYLTVGVGHQFYACNKSSMWEPHGAEAVLESEDHHVNSTKVPTGSKHPNQRTYKKVGRHFFKNGVPTFELDNIGTVTAKKAKAADAPNSKRPSVKWLQLDVVSGTLATVVYRTSTSGGVPPPEKCTGSRTIKVYYNAIYSFWLPAHK